MSEPMNSYQKLKEVRKAVPYLQKTKKEGSGAKYATVNHDQVNSAIRDHLIEQGIIAEPHLIKAKSAATGKTTRSGVPYIRQEAIYDIHFVNMDNPEDRAIVRVSGHGEDEGDKAPGKALSYAVKSAELKLFNISTGDDDEARVEAVPEGEGVDENMVKTFAETMVAAITEKGGRYVIGRASINQADLLARAHQGTRGKEDGYFSSNEKTSLRDASSEYIAEIKEYAVQIAESVKADESSTVDMLLEELGDDPTDKKLLWANIDDTTRAYIKERKA